MQQTKKYRLNLIETSDTFSPAPLNENAQKLETALAAKADAAQAAADHAALIDSLAAANSARADGDTALMQRIIALENKRIVLGTYVGTAEGSSEVQAIELGFPPVRVILIQNNLMHIIWENHPLIQNSYWGVRLTDKGFEVRNIMNLAPNTKGTQYGYIAFSA